MRDLVVEPVDVREDAGAAREILGLQRAAYAVEAALIGSDRIPALRETLSELRAARMKWLGARDGGRLVGAVAYERLGDGTLDICKLVVAPAAFRRGVGTALLDALDIVEPAGHTTVSTGAANLPAVRLYERRGFVSVATVEVVPGLWTTRFARGPIA